MRILTHVFAAAGTVDYQIGGRYLRLISTSAPVDIVPLEVGREMTEEKATAVEAGFATRPLDGFDGFRLTSSVAQTVRVAITSGSGSYDRTTGDVSILGTVPVSGPLTDAQLRATAVPVSGPLTNAQLLAALLQPHVSLVGTTNYKSSTNLAANTPDTIFAAAANTNGAILWRGNFFSNNSTGPNLTALLTKATAPASAIDGTVIASTDSATAVAGSWTSFINLELPVRIPAGVGLFYIASLGEGSALRHLNYTLLP